jgi:hypothetical protein
MHQNTVCVERVLVFNTTVEFAKVTSQYGVGINVSFNDLLCYEYESNQQFSVFNHVLNNIGFSYER